MFDIIQVSLWSVFFSQMVFTKLWDRLWNRLACFTSPKILQYAASLSVFYFLKCGCIVAFLTITILLTGKSHFIVMIEM